MSDVYVGPDYASVLGFEQTFVTLCKGRSRAAATSKMQHFVIIVNG